MTLVGLVITGNKEKEYIRLKNSCTKLLLSIKFRLKSSSIYVAQYVLSDIVVKISNNAIRKLFLSPLVGLDIQWNYYIIKKYSNNVKL